MSDGQKLAHFPLFSTDFLVIRLLLIKKHLLGVFVLFTGQLGFPNFYYVFPVEILGRFHVRHVFVFKVHNAQFVKALLVLGLFLFFDGGQFDGHFARILADEGEVEPVNWVLAVGRED